MGWFADFDSLWWGGRRRAGNLPFFGDDKRRFSWQDLKDHMKSVGKAVQSCGWVVTAAVAGTVRACPRGFADEVGLCAIV